jgi:hypothetical protein
MFVLMSMMMQVLVDVGADWLPHSPVRAGRCSATPRTTRTPSASCASWWSF